MKTNPEELSGYMTVREAFAMAAMTGLMANSLALEATAREIQKHGGNAAAMNAQVAVEAADALILELNKATEKQI